MTLEDMIARRDALLAARWRGVRTVEVEGRRITYASDAEMAAALGDLVPERQDHGRGPARRGDPPAETVFGTKRCRWIMVRASRAHPHNGRPAQTSRRMRGRFNRAGRMSRLQPTIICVNLRGSA